MRNDREKLRDILEAIERIERYAIQGRQSFEEDELIQTQIVCTFSQLASFHSGKAEIVSWKIENPHIPDPADS